MFKCECGREFTTTQGLGFHKKYCGNYKIFLDGGYEAKIGIDGNMVYIHREVMEQKLGRKLRLGELVHHKDENKRNNEPDNLELSNNSIHTKRHFLNSDLYKFGSENKNSVLTEEQVINIKRLLSEGITKMVLSKRLGISYSTIWNIDTGQTWSHLKI